MNIFTEDEKSILLNLIDAVDVDDFTNEEWDSLNVIRLKVAGDN